MIVDKDDVNELVHLPGSNHLSGQPAALVHRILVRGHPADCFVVLIPGSGMSKAENFPKYLGCRIFNAAPTVLSIVQSTRQVLIHNVNDT